MDQLTSSILINRDPPAFLELRELANTYIGSSELLKVGNLNMGVLRQIEWNSFIINNQTALAWTRKNPQPYFIRSDFTDNIHLYSGWSCMLLDLEGIAAFLEGTEINLEEMEPYRRVKAYSSWHRALYDAIEYECKRPVRVNFMKRTTQTSRLFRKTFKFDRSIQQ